MALGITGVVPATGPNTGGNVVDITGTDLDTVTTLTFGGTAAITFAAKSATLMTATVPAHANGAVDVVVGDGTTTQTLTGGYTYAAPDSTEQLTSALARKFKVDIDTSLTSTPVWTQVRGIGELKPSIDSTLQDDSDYDSDGWGSQAKTAMSWALELKLVRKLGVTSSNYDPGQEKIRAAADAFGGDSIVHVRWYDRNGGPEAYEGHAVVTWAPEGGDAKALDTVTATLNGQGARLLINNPAA